MSRLLAPLAVVVGVVLLFGTTPYWWFGAGFVVAGLAVATLAWREPLQSAWSELAAPRKLGPLSFSPQRLIKDLTCLTVIIGVATALVFPSFTGDPPVSADHPVHMYRAWQLNEMIFDGRFYGWSNAWFAGYPAQYLYPIGGDLWVNLVWGATLGIASFYTAYALAIWGMFTLQGVAIWLLARRDAGRVAATLAALFVLGDSGAFRLGGWVFGMHWGVWPQNFCVVLGVLAAWKLRDVVLGQERRHIALFGLFMGASILTHPLMIIFWAAAIPLALFAIVTSRENFQKSRAILRMVVGTILGGLVAAFWLLPFLSARGFSEGYGTGWQSSFSLGEAIYGGSIFAGTWATVIIIGGFVLLGWFGARRFMPTFLAAMGFAFVIGGSTDLVSSFHLLEISDAFGFLQYTRFPILAKPFWFIAAAFGFVTLVRRVPELADETRARLASERGDDAPDLVPWSERKGALFLRLAVLGTLVAPLAFGWLASLRADQFSRGLTELSERAENPHRTRLKAYINEAAADVDGLARVGIDFGHDEHSMHDFQIGLDVPVYKIGFTPATTFKYKMKGRNPGLLEQMNVRWVITRGRALSKASFEQVMESGGLRLYEFEGWRPEPFTVDGEGKVELESFSPEEIVVRAGEGASGELVVHVSYFDRWKAYRDGEPIELRPTENVSERQRTGFMAVDLEPGTYRFAYERHAPERLAWVALFLALLLGLLLVLSDMGRRPGPRLAGAWNAVEGRVVALENRFEGRWRFVVGTTVIAVFVGLLLLANWKPAPELEFDPPVHDVKWDLANDLGSASVGLETDGRRRHCFEIFGRHFCGEASWQHVFATYAGFADDEWRRCVWAHPQQGSKLAINVDDLPAGSRLVGYYGVAATGASRRPTPADLLIAMDGEAIFEGSTKRDATVYPIDVPLSGTESDLKIEVSAKNTGRRHVCLLLQVVE